MNQPYDEQSNAESDVALSEKEEENLNQTHSLKSEFSFKNSVIVRVGKTEKEASNVILKTVSEPIPCQESEEDYIHSDERCISFKEEWPDETTVMSDGGAERDIEECFSRLQVTSAEARVISSQPVFSGESDEEAKCLDNNYSTTVRQA